ncbi:NF-kappa-B inhibitor beta-like [Tropilaelaps mercedesae]|uniref:NF-kappa-B inhibitor beta-like n=1 Tax=Tropilaelaps mercedesae TaxID=418985 RepID=A0A1V9X525_9ACAR|nr:NF-kappa-B inhibitor beta-like [Tropilaelaps mercedesae]
MHLYLCNKRSRCCVDLCHFNCFNSRCSSSEGGKPNNGKITNVRITPTYSRLRAVENRLKFAMHKPNVGSGSSENAPDSGIALEEPTTLRWENIYAQDELGDTLLHRVLASTAACGKNAPSHREQILRIIQSTPSPDLFEITNNWGQTALHVACEHKDAWSARRLILSGAIADRPDNLRFTPLHIAVQKGSVELIHAITKPISVDELRELALSFYGNYSVKKEYWAMELIQLLRRKETDVFNKARKASYTLTVTPAQPRTKLVELSQLCSLGMTPLHLAVKSGNLLVLEEILPFAYHLDTRELLEGRTALQLAIDLRRADMVKALLKAGAATEQEDYAGCTALARLLRLQALSGEDKKDELNQCVLLLRASGAMEPDMVVYGDDDASDNDGETVVANVSDERHQQGCRPKDQVACS